MAVEIEKLSQSIEAQIEEAAEEEQASTQKYPPHTHTTTNLIEHESSDA